MNMKKEVGAGSFFSVQNMFDLLCDLPLKKRLQCLAPAAEAQLTINTEDGSNTEDKKFPSGAVKQKKEKLKLF